MNNKQMLSFKHATKFKWIFLSFMHIYRKINESEEDLNAANSSLIIGFNSKMII